MGGSPGTPGKDGGPNDGKPIGGSGKFGIPLGGGGKGRLLGIPFGGGGKVPRFGAGGRFNALANGGGGGKFGKMKLVPDEFDPFSVGGGGKIGKIPVFKVGGGGRSGKIFEFVLVNDGFPSYF